MKNRTIILTVASIASFLTLLAGLTYTARSKAQAPPPTRAIAVINPTEGNKVHGLVTFTKEGDQVKVTADIEGLTPGKHGFHIHEYGDCSSKDGANAGGHFNPTGMRHGAPTDSDRHKGDMGNLDAGPDGKALLSLSDPVMKLEGPDSILGRAVIVHANPDDLKTQPTGNAGGRLACGVIGAAKP